MSRAGETAAMDLAGEDGGGANLQVGAGAAMWSNSDGEGLEATGVQVARSLGVTAEALVCFGGARTTGIRRPPWRLRTGGRQRRCYGHGGEVRATRSWWVSAVSLCGNEGDEL